MADPFEGRGPAEEANSGFKLFGLSVNQFAAAVATLDLAKNAIDKQLNKTAKQQAQKARDEENVAKKNNEAAEKQTEAAQGQKDAADLMNKVAKGQSRQLGGLDKITSKFRDIAEAFKQNMSSGFGKLTGGLKGILGNLGSVLKDFAGRFVVIFTAVQLLTRILQRLVGVANISRTITRQFGPGFNFTSLFQEASTKAARAGIAVNEEKVRDIAVALNEELLDSRKITGGLVGDIAILSRGLNLDATVSAQFFGKALRTTDATVQDIKMSLADVANIAGDVGLTIDGLVGDLAKAPQLAQQWVIATRQGRLELARSAAQAKLLGTDLSAVRQFGDQFFDFSQATETAARLQGLGIGGQNFSATGLVKGALGDPTKTVLGILQGIEGQFGKLGATGVDRAILQQILSTIPALQSVFGTVEDLSAALAQTDRAAAVADAQAQQINRERAAQNFEVNSLAFLNTLVTQGDSIDQKLEDMADNIATKIASYLQPLFNQLVNAIANLTTSVNRFLPGATGDPIAEEQKAIRKDFISNVEARLSSQARSGTGVFEDLIAERQEIRDLVKNTAGTVKLDASDDEIDKFVDRIMGRLERAGASRIRLGHLDPDNEIRLRLVDANGRTLFTAITDEKGTK